MEEILYCQNQKMVREERQIFRPTMIRSKVLLLVMTNFLITSTSKIEPVFPRFRRMDAPSKEKSVCDKKDPNAYRDPCCDFPASKVFDGNFMTPKERECVKSKCPGDQHPKTKGVYFASVFNKKSGKYDAFKFLKEKEIKDRVTQTVPCGGSKLGTPQRFGENKENCVCKCEKGYMGRFQKRGGMNDCDINANSVLNFQSDCIEMDDSYMINCFQIASTICKPYSMTWRYECVRTCMALRGQSCIVEKYQRFCSHDPECPAMCNAMMSEYCQRQAMQLLKTPEQKKTEESLEKQVIQSGGGAEEEDNPSDFLEGLINFGSDEGEFFR